MDNRLDSVHRDQALNGEDSSEHDEQYNDGHFVHGCFDTTHALEAIPPPVGLHSDCVICDENYYTVKQQQEALSTPGRKDTFCTLYKGSFKDEKTAQASFLLQLKMVTEDLNYLRHVLENYEDLIMNRWNKKSRHKRGVLLDSAARVCFGVWPPATARELSVALGRDIDTTFLGKQLTLNLLRRSGACGAWINIEEFAEDKTNLLKLLHVCSAYPPCDWATFDAHEMTHYFKTPISSLIFNEKCVKMSGKEYGNLVDLDVKLIHSGEALRFPRAWATVCIQTYLASALRNIVNELVAGAPPSGNLKWTKLVSEGFHSSATGTRCGMYDSRGLTSPSRFDPEMLLEIATGQLNRIVDEVELLQNDPEYMRDCALNMEADISWHAGVSSSLKWSYIASTIA